MVVMRLAACMALLACFVFAQKPEASAEFREGVDAQQRGDDISAVKHYRLFLQVSPNSVDAVANLGAALAHLGKFDEAVVQYRAALKSDPNNSAILMNLGLAFYKNGDARSAAEQFEAVHKLQPGDTRAAILLGDCYQRLGQEDQVLALLGPMDASTPGNPDLEYVLASALIHSGKRKAGAEMMQRVAKATNSADCYMRAGIALMDLNELESALGDFDQAMRLDPKLPGIHTLSGVVRDKLGDQAGAEPELRKALQVNPADFQANLVLGAILFKARKTDEARHHVERAAEIDPSSPLARYELALLKISLNQLDSAAVDLEQVVAQNPKWLEPHIRLAALYYSLHREADGANERRIVDRLTAQQQQEASGQEQ